MPLKPSQTAELKTQLKRRYRELWSDVRREIVKADAEVYPEVAGEVHDSGDEATADVVVDLDLAEIHRDIQEMRDISAALERMSGQTYGVCADCGDDIAIERLRIHPAAARCTACQTRYEHTHVSTIGPRL